jgi:succinoglycan biosynthesis transport protein ExoP
MEHQPDERSTAELFSQYAGLLLRWSWLLILMAALAGGVAYYISSLQTPIYQASAMMMINIAPSSQYDTYTTIITSQQFAGTYAQVMTTRPVLDAVATRLGLPAIDASINVKPIENTQLMRVTVQDTDPLRASMIANTLVVVFGEQIQADQATRYADSKRTLEDQLGIVEAQIKTTSEALIALGVDPVTSTGPVGGNPNAAQVAQLETTLAQYRQSYATLLQSYEQVRLAEAQSASSILLKDPAVPPGAPIQPQPLRSALLAAASGLLLAAGVVFLIEFLDDTIRDPEEIARSWGVPVMGIILKYNSGVNELVTTKEPRSPTSEAFRSLRTNLQFASAASPIRTLLVTSASPMEGKTTITANLAAVIAQTGRTVVVVDADLRRPRIHKIFQLSNHQGLTDQFLRPMEHLDGVVKPTEVKDLFAITSGNLPPNPSELLSSEKMSNILKELTKQFNAVLLDTPPTLFVTDALVLASRVDGVLLVVKPSITKRTDLRHAIDQMRRVNANLLGVIVNDVKASRIRNYYYRGYSYSKKYGKEYLYAESAGLPAGQTRSQGTHRAAGSTSFQQTSAVETDSEWETVYPTVVKETHDAIILKKFTLDPTAANSPQIVVRETDEPVRVNKVTVVRKNEDG